MLVAGSVVKSRQPAESQSKAAAGAMFRFQVRARGRGGTTAGIGAIIGLPLVSSRRARRSCRAELSILRGTFALAHMRDAFRLRRNGHIDKVRIGDQQQI